MSIKKLCSYTLLSVAVLLVLFRVLAGEEFACGITKTTMVTEKAIVGEILSETMVEQEFYSENNSITGISVLGTNFGRQIDDTLKISLLDAEGKVITEVSLDTLHLPDGKPWNVEFPAVKGDYKGQILTLRFQSMRGEPGAAVSLYYGDSVGNGRYEIPVASDFALLIDGTDMGGQLCLSVTGKTVYWLAQYYWAFAAVVFLLVGAVCGWLIYCNRKGKSGFAMRFVAAGVRYRFLLKELVARDFKTKYKRSVLGILWSFMNPLLTMMVMYIVFSTLFKSNIENFPVYLLTGIVCWNFFNESTGSCLTSITGNAALITKVYVPKYIYPLARAVSSCVNLFMSLIPLLMVMLLTKAAITPRLLLLPFPLVCLFMFSFGVGLFLASWMVMFRDTQFLWGVVSMLWMYLTPIFYDASIIPAEYMTLYELNPLYHIIYVMRTLLIDGVSPAPETYLFCALLSAVPLLLGALVFKKTQDRFVLYL